LHFSSPLLPPPVQNIDFPGFSEKSFKCRKLNKGGIKCIKKKNPPPAEGGRQEVKKSHS
jgi:hypothetical protein